MNFKKHYVEHTFAIYLYLDTLVSLKLMHRKEMVELDWVTYIAVIIHYISI